MAEDEVMFNVTARWKGKWEVAKVYRGSGKNVKIEVQVYVDAAFR